MSPAGAPVEPAAPPRWPIPAYVAAFASYVTLGYLTRSWVLNWIVGPLYLLLTLHVLPNGLRRLRGRPR